MKNKYLYGADASHYQREVPKTSFAICKCTESLSFVDPTYKAKKKFCRDNGILFGAYHFLHNNPIEEAKHFLNNIGDLKEGELVALDAETGQSPELCEKFLKYVENKLGFKPFIYAPVKNWNKSVDYPLWVARYGRNNGKINEDQPPNIGKFKDWVIWQYTSANGLDRDVFRGTIEELKKYGNKLTSNKMDKIKETKKAIKKYIFDFKNFINEKEDVKVAKKIKELVEDANTAIRGNEILEEDMKDMAVMNKKLKEENAELSLSLENNSYDTIETKALQVSLNRLKSSLNGYIVRVKNQKKTIEEQDKRITELQGLNQGNAKDAKIVDSLVFFIKSIISKIK